MPSADISIVVMTYSGYERMSTPADAGERVRRLLDSICKNTIHRVPRLIVSDEESGNRAGRDKVQVMTRSYGFEHTTNIPWGGVSANYNHAVRQTDTEWVICLSDDTIVTRNWLEPMEWFIAMNRDLSLGQLGWPLLFTYRLMNAKILNSPEDMYNPEKAVENLDPKELYRHNEDGMGFEPYLRGNCSGSAFVINRDIFDKMGGFPEDNFQPDEYFGWWTWMHTNSICVQVPCPPIWHYGGASSWGHHGDDADSPYNTSRESWFKRTGTTFDNRGWDSTKVANRRMSLVKGMFRCLEWWEEPWISPVVDIECHSRTA